MSSTEGWRKKERGIRSPAERGREMGEGKGQGEAEAGTEKRDEQGEGQGQWDTE